MFYSYFEFNVYKFTEKLLQRNFVLKKEKAI